MSWAQGNEEPHKAAVRASIVAQASRRLSELNGPKASNDRWSQGTQEDGLRRNKDE